MHRLFFALWPDEAVRLAIAETAEQQQALQPGGRAVRPERYHMTLQFLGAFEVLTAAMHASLLAAVGTIEARGSFDLRLDRVGRFDAGRVAWLGCSSPPGQLMRLQQDLGEALANGGIAPNAAAGFVPHVTVHRNAGGPGDGPIRPLRWHVSDFVLIDSTGGEYRRLGQWSVVPA